MTATVTRAPRVLQSFSATTADGTTVSIDIDALAGAADSGDLSEDVTDLLLAAGEALADRSGGLLLCVDEVQYLTADELGALIAAIHRTAQRDLPVVLVGAGLPQLPALAGQAKSYAERLFEFSVVGSLSPTEAGAADAVVRASLGTRASCRSWGYHLWNAADGPRITAELVEAVRPRVVRHLDEHCFLVRFDRLTRKEQDYLRAMAAHGDTAFTAPMFDAFLLRTGPPPPRRTGRPDGVAGWRTPAGAEVSMAA